MATAALKGDARLEYGATTHLLAAPLLELEPADVQPLKQFESADLTTRHIVTIGDGVRELHGTIRFENEPNALKALLRAALYEDETVTYRESGGGTGYPVKIVGTDTGGAALRPDRQRYGFGEWEVRVHLRATSGTLDGLL
ncbi:MAG TPA: hypothetical protein VK966_01325 [Longimicrobiales bacterium]|nr:hypothetical protein [Longimicrobiales bacterium]